MISLLKRLAAVIAAFAILLGGYALFVRPWFMRWGATAAEIHAVLPGDEIVGSRANAVTTRAITIGVSADAIWPWLAQLGQDRGGFYSYQLLENLAGCNMKNAEWIHPEFQKWRIGDKLWMYPPDRAGGIGHAALLRLEPGEAMGFATRLIGTPLAKPYDGSWSFVLRPIDARSTRLIARGRAGGERSLGATAFDQFVFDPMHYVMERKMMTGIKLRAEGGKVSDLADNTQVLLWSITFVLFWTSAVLVLTRAKWLTALASMFAAGVSFQVLTFTQPALAIGAVLVLGIVAILWRPSGPASTASREARIQWLRFDPEPGLTHPRGPAG